MNAIVAILGEDDELMTICLSGSIISEDGTADSQSRAIIQSFAESAQLLEDWRDVIAEMYPGRQDLLDEIPLPEELCVSKLLGGTMSSDNCDTARKTTSKTTELIYAIARAKGFSEEELRIYIGHCHHHLRNVWVGAISNHLARKLTELMKNDLDLIPHHIRVSCDLMSVHRMVDKETNHTAHYAKGHGDQFQDFSERRFQGKIRYPVIRVLGGKR